VTVRRVDPDGVGGLARGRLELVAHVQRVREVPSRAGLLGRQGEGLTERLLGEPEPRRVGRDTEFLEIGVPESVVRPGIDRALLEPTLVAGDGAVRGRVIGGRGGGAEGSSGRPA
jgi:hypothetical protein